MSKKTKYLLSFVTVITLLFFIEKWVNKKVENYPQPNVSLQKNGVNEFNQELLPTSKGEVVKHIHYSLSYREDHEQAEWVAYYLAKDHLSKNDFERPYFIQDRAVTTQSADWRNYKNSGYDRGHLCPAGDRRFSYEAYHETFLTSNISPQNKEFNAGVWNYLEQKVRYWASKYDGVYVITGGILQPQLKTIGNEKVSIPETFYKIVVDYSNQTYKVIAFLIPNEPTQKSFYNYVVTVDEIETLTGIDFLHQLPDEIENTIEAQKDVRQWSR